MTQSIISSGHGDPTRWTKVLGPAPNSPLTNPEAFADRIPDVDSQSDEQRSAARNSSTFAAELNKLHSDQLKQRMAVIGPQKTLVNQ